LFLRMDPANPDRKENEMKITEADLHKKVLIKVDIKDRKTMGCFGEIQSIVRDGEYAVINVYKQNKNLACGTILVSMDEIELIDEEEFQPDYFTGLPHDVSRAKKYIGMSMEFSDDGIRWGKGLLERAGEREPGSNFTQYKYKRDGIGYFMYCRTCKETFKPETWYIKFGPGRIPAPATEEPAYGDTYYTIDFSEDDFYAEYGWDNYESDKKLFKNGIWLKEEHIQEVVGVIRGIMGREE
jgi:hypothetical protein